MIHCTLAVLAPGLAATVAVAAPATQPSEYPLAVDVMSGEPLPADGGIVEKIDGREVHFATKDSAAAFKAGGEASQKKMDALVAAAEKPNYQLKTCPVSDEKLGEMGKPIEYVDRATNRLIVLCCKGCVSKVKKDATAALDKIDAAQAKS